MICWTSKTTEVYDGGAAAAVQWNLHDAQFRFFLLILPRKNATIIINLIRSYPIPKVMQKTRTTNVSKLSNKLKLVFCIIILIILNLHFRPIGHCRYTDLYISILYYLCVLALAIFNLEKRCLNLGSHQDSKPSLFI